MVIRKVPRFARTQITADDGSSDPELRDRERDRALGARSPYRSAAKIYRRVELMNWLREEHGLGAAHAGAVATRLLSTAPRIRGAFLRWWLTGQVEDLEVEGYSLRRLVNDRGMSPIGALLTLSLLAADERVTPEELADRRQGDLDLEETLERAEA